MDIKKEIEDVISRYPTLSYNSEKNELLGELEVANLDFYDLRIDLNPYPKFFPHVYETEDRIPKKVERHIYTDTKSCCLTTQAKSQVLLSTKIKNLTLFIKDIVIPYLQNNSYFEINKEYKTDEYAHNGFGVIEGYRDILQTNNDLAIARLMERRIKGNKLKIYHLCYCESGNELKKCNNSKHNKCYTDFKKIDKEVLQNDLVKVFIPYFKRQELIK
jgi:hypothetical protein